MLCTPGCLMFMQLVFPIQPNPNPFLLKEAFANGCAKGSWQLHPVIRMLRKSSKTTWSWKILGETNPFYKLFLLLPNCFHLTEGNVEQYNLLDHQLSVTIMSPRSHIFQENLRQGSARGTTGPAETGVSDLPQHSGLPNWHGRHVPQMVL